MIRTSAVGAVSFCLLVGVASTWAAREDALLRCDFGPLITDRFATELAAIRQRNGITPPRLEDGETVALRFARNEARPQDRWLTGEIEISSDLGAPGELTLEIALFAVGERNAIARIETRPDRAIGRIEVDLRTPNLRRARLVARLRTEGQWIGAAETFVSALPAERLAVGTRIPVRLDVPDHVAVDQARPLNFGVPFGPGSLWDVKQLRVTDSSGKALPGQFEILARWSREGSIQWVRGDAIAAPAEGVFVEVAPEFSPTDARLRIEPVGDGLRIDTGAARYTLARGSSPIAEVSLGGRRVASSEGAKGLYVIDQVGRVARAAAAGESMVIESRGPVAACVRFEGDYRADDGRRLARHITRLEFHAGSPEARVQHTLVITEDSNQVWFTDIGWELSVETGSDATASFAVDRRDARHLASHRLNGADDTAWLLQDQHRRFKHGKNHFALTSVNGVLHEGEECGDWFALQGNRGGLGWSCRDAAWQHPKEFETRPNRMTLHLWSSRAGEQLDFKLPTLVKRWNLEDWLRRVAPRRDQARIPELVEQARRIKHNAVGWAKTHELLLRPLFPADQPETMAIASAAHSRPVLALADPEWLYQSQAMGPLHPRDPKRFPEVEAAIDGAADWWHERIHAWGEYGFGDYYAGPHLSYQGDVPSPKRYHWATYGLRPGLWMVYARGGDRGVFELAAKNNQSFMDNHFAHWDGPGKARGRYLGISEGGDALATPATLPLYWQARTSGNISSSTDLNQFLHDYFLTGNRRARDVVEQYARAAKKIWSPKEIQGSWRALTDLRCLAQCLRLDWDPELRAMVAASLEIVSDDDSAVGLTKDRPYHASTYKTQADFGALADVAEILGTPRAEKVMLKVARYQAPLQFGSSPFGYNSPAGRVGHILHAETADASIAEAMGLQLRWLSSGWDRTKNDFRVPGSAAGMLFLTQGAPYALDVVRRAGGWNAAAASWIGAEGFGEPVSFVVRKPERSAVTLWLRSPRAGKPGDAGGRVSVRALNPPNAWGLDLNRVDSDSNFNTRIELPKDAPEAAYEITPSGEGAQLLRADARVPLVLHAPGYWLPAPPQDPPLRWHFRVPADADGAAIFFEGAARLFDPAGQAFPSTKPQRGWIALPKQRPGRWSFEMLERKLVRVRNLPPFFALRDPEFLFEPPIAWERESVEVFTRPDPATVYVDGAIAAANNRALHVTGKRRLMISGADTLPFEQGTIEFWYRPNYNSLELTQGGGLISLDVARGRSWNLGLRHGDGEQWFHSRSLLGSFETDGASKRRNVRCYRQTLFESGRWFHVAWTWGLRRDLAARGGNSVLKSAAQGVFTQRIYIDGKAGKFTPDDLPGNLPVFSPTRLRTSAAFDGAIDELRISNTMRYLEDFDPPTRKRPLTADEATLALLHFDGNLNVDHRADRVAVELR